MIRRIVPSPSPSPAHVAAALAALSLAWAGCAGPTYVRGSEMKDLDEYAMSTGLDKKDLEGLFEENWKSLTDGGLYGRWRTGAEGGDVARVAVFPFANETSEHIDGPLDALLSKVETRLVNSGFVDVISRERQKELVEELRTQSSAAFDPAKAGALGRQMGARYFITGKVHDSAERTGGERRVQYFLFMQVVDVETGGIRWQNEAGLTKGLVN